MNVETPRDQLFDLHAIARTPARRRLLGLAEFAFGRVLSLKALNRLYADLLASGGGTDLLGAALWRLNIQSEVSHGSLDNVPREGPVLLVANHPFGMVDAFLLTAVLRDVRPDIKILANAMLTGIPEARPYMIPVNPFASREAAAQNAGALRDALRTLRAGGALGIFPAGEVAHLHLRGRRVSDGHWNPAVARLARRTEATVVPIVFHGRNSNLFQLAGLLNGHLRTALLPREFLGKRDTRIRLSVGRALPWAHLAQFQSDDELTGYLRLCAELLKVRGFEAVRGWRWRSLGRRTQAVAPQPAAPGLQQKLAREARALPPEQVLVEQGPYRVFQGTAAQLPGLVEELGRLREISFRAVGEGTGRATDVDEFDGYYRHLVLWNREKEEVAGAYRFGPMDEIVRERGAGGLYLSTLFRLQPALLRAIDPCLELGRSFVRPEYQRGYLPLMLLWKGLAQFILANPQYRHLIGPVSVNAQYRPLSRKLLMDYLLRHHRHERLAPFAQPLHPPRLAGLFGFPGRETLPLPQELEHLTALVEELEPEQAGVPILLKHYLRLGGKVLGFNVDPQFSHVLDALVLVDVTRAERRTQERFMGRAEAERFMAWHRARGTVGDAQDALAPQAIPAA